LSKKLNQISTISKKRLLILGATGSVGESTLDVVRQHPDKFEITTLIANNNHELWRKQS